MANTWKMPAGLIIGTTTFAKLTIVSPDGPTDPDYKFSLEFNNGLALSIPPFNGLTYRWTAPPGIVLSSETVPNPTFIAPEVATDTEFKFTLVVNDGIDDSPPDEVIVKVLHVNKSPSANAGSNQSVNEGETVSLDGSASSDPDGDPLTYHWNAPSGITLSSATDVKPSFITPEINEITNLIFTLVVNDGKKDSPPDQVIVTVKLDNTAPVANAGIDQMVNEGSLTTLDATGSSDPDGDHLNYFWTAPSGITLSSINALKPTFLAPEVQNDTEFVFSLVVNDGTVSSITDQVTVTVKQVNKVPLANAGNDQSLNEGTLVHIDGSGSYDPDNDAINYFWLAPQEIALSSNNSPSPTFTAPEVMVNTDYVFYLIVSDAYNNSVADQVTISVNQVNKEPVANAGPDQTVNEGEKVTLNGADSSDPDNNGITFQWTAPSGIILSSTRDSKPTFTAPEVSVNTVFTFQLTVNDGALNSTADQVNVLVKQVNKAPVANAGPDQVVTESNLVTLDATASTDPDNDNLTYQWTAPPGITLSSGTNPKPTFTSPETQSNTDYTFTLVVNDGQVNSPEDRVIITVIPRNEPPVANAGIDIEVNENELVTLDGSASADLELAGLTYLWKAPQGINLSSATGPYPSFYAPEVKADTTLTFSLIVNDGVNNSTADLVLIHVRQVNKAPEYISSRIFYANVNEHFEFRLEGYDVDGDPVNIQINNLPSFLTLSKYNPTSATLSGTFDDQTIENYFLNVVLSDGGLLTEGTITINITKDDHAPYVKDSIQDISVDRRSPDKVIDLNSVLADDDPGDTLDFRIFSNTNPEVVNALISGTNLILSFSTEAAGIAEIAVNAISKGRIATSKFQVEVKHPTEIDFQITDADIRIFPNPTMGIIRVDFKQIPAPNTWIRIYDSSGRMIEKKDRLGKNEIFNLENFTPGVYFIKVDPEFSKTYKIILK
jgi:hypothetical protein